MNISRRVFGIVAAGACVGSQFSLAANPTDASKPEQAIRAAARDGKLLYLVFYKEPDAAMKAMATTVSTAMNSQDGQSTFAYVRLTDPVERAVAEQFKVTRAPMPMVIAVHPNGAVTGFYHTKTTEKDLAKCLVSPKQAECLKALQTNQLVLVCLQTQAKQSIPQGVRDLKADPHFAARTQVITLQVSDPAEASFLAGLEVDPKKTAPMTVFMAPPGAIVGKFTTTATKDQLAAKLAEAGQCCDDENCKHNHPQTTKPRKATR